MILRAWARNISSLAKKSTMLGDLVSSEEFALSLDTFDDYVGAFIKLFVIDDIEAWCPPIRSKTSIRSGLKREFTDPSIAVAALGAYREFNYATSNNLIDTSTVSPLRPASVLLKVRFSL